MCCFCGVSYLVQWWRGVGKVVLGKEQVDEDCRLRGTKKKKEHKDIKHLGDQQVLYNWNT